MTQACATSFFRRPPFALLGWNRYELASKEGGIVNTARICPECYREHGETTPQLTEHTGFLVQIATKSFDGKHRPYQVSVSAHCQRHATERAAQIAKVEQQEQTALL